MSSYSSKAAVDMVIRHSLMNDGHDPALANIAAIRRECFRDTGFYGWRVTDTGIDSEKWHACLERHANYRKAPAQ